MWFQNSSRCYDRQSIKWTSLLIRDSAQFSKEIASSVLPMSSGIDPVLSKVSEIQHKISSCFEFIQLNEVSSGFKCFDLELETTKDFSGNLLFNTVAFFVCLLSIIIRITPEFQHRIYQVKYDDAKSRLRSHQEHKLNLITRCSLRWSSGEHRYNVNSRWS